MKKSVRIRKAGPGETPGYYNSKQIKAQTFLKKASLGMQVGADQQQIIKTIMMDTYAALRDGTNPNIVFEDLVINKRIPEEAAYQIMDTVMKKLAENNLANPDYLESDEEDDYAAQSNQGAPAENNNVASNTGSAPSNTGEEEELALSEAEYGTEDDAMNHFNNREDEEDEQEEISAKYGGYYDDGGEYEGVNNYFADQDESPEDTVIDQYSNPGELNDKQSMPFSLDRLIKFTPGVQEYNPTPDVQTYLNMYPYENVADIGIPNDLLPMSQAKFGGELPKARNGRVAAEGPGKRGRKKKTETEVRVEPTEQAPMNPRVTVVPQEAPAMTPDVLQRFQNYFTKKNFLSDRSTAGKFVEGTGTVINTLRPQNWRENSTLFGMIGGRDKVAPATTATQTYQDVINKIMDPNYETKVIQPNTDGTYSSGLAFNMGTELSQQLLNIGKEHGVMTGLKKGQPVTIEVPTSSVPELNFLSLHNNKNKTQIRLTMDTEGKIKAELITDVKTKLKGFDNNSLTIKDELVIDPKQGQILDFKTGMPLEMIQKSYYTGNQLNWWNKSNMSADQLAGYPKVVSTEALNKKPATGWNKFLNLGVAPVALGPLAAFSYPGFAERAKFTPNAVKVTADFLGRQREIGPQSPGGMTFGDQPLGTQYADFNLQSNRNYNTGKNFLIGAGLLGGFGTAGYLYYNRNTDDFIQDSEGATTNYDFNNPQVKPGFGFSKDINWGRKRPTVDYQNNYGRDSMNVINGDTLHDKGWGAPSEDYKKGGALKKKFIKNVTQMFAPGGEAQDPSLGKGSRMDMNDMVGSKKSNFIYKLKKNSDHAMRDELYKNVQKSGDPTLMNIFMGQGQEEEQQPMMPQNPMVEEGGYVNMDMQNPLTRFVYGGMDPDYYEPNDILPEALDGTPRCPNGYTYNKSTGKCEKDGQATNPAMDPYNWFLDQTGPDNWPGAIGTNEPGDNRLAYTVDADGNEINDPTEEAAYNKWFDDYMADTSEAEAKRFQDYQNYLNFYSGSDEQPPAANNNIPTINNQTQCPPGTQWSAKYNQCVPIAKINYIPRVVSGDPGLHNIFLPWNPVFRNKGYKIKQGKKIKLSDLSEYTGENLGTPIVNLKYKKHLLAPKRELNIYNPDGKLSAADIQKLMEYGIGESGYKNLYKNVVRSGNRKAKEEINSIMDKNKTKNKEREGINWNAVKYRSNPANWRVNSSKKEKTEKSGLNVNALKYYTNPKNWKK